MTATNIRSTLRAHWFVLAAILVAASDFTVAKLDNWSNPEILEAAILFDLGVVIPALYFWCYRSRGKAAVLRAVALSCLGIWVAGHVVPSEHHHLLSAAGFVRYIGLAVLVVIELKLVFMIYRTAFRRESNATILTAANDAGLPKWVAHLLAWEASLWLRAWDALRRMSGRG